MRFERANRATERDNPRLIFRRLLNIKRQREKRLRRLSAGLSRQYARVQEEIQQAQRHRMALLAMVEEKMHWSGVVNANEVLGYKREMERLYREERQQVMNQQTLSADLKQIQEQREKVNTELHLVMKKQEKLRMLLEDDTYQN